MNHRYARNYIPFPTGDWGQPGHVGVNDADQAWGDPGGDGDNDDWGDPADGARTAAVDDWGAPSGGQDWGVPAPAADTWGQPASPASMHGRGGYGNVTKKSSLKRKGGAHGHPQRSVSSTPPLAQAPAHPASFHPSAAAHMSSAHWGAPSAPQDWGPPPAATAWGEPPGWGAPSASKPPAPPPAPPKPAWTNWVNEAKGLPMVNTPPAPTAAYSYPAQSTAMGGRQAVSDRERSQILNSLLQAPNQYTKDYFSQAQAQRSHRSRHESAQPYQSRTMQTAHLNQQWQDPRLVAEQEAIISSLQEARSQGHSQNAQYGHPQPVQQADSWGYMAGNGWGERASTIPEEEEYEETDGDEWDEGSGAGWGAKQASSGRVRFSPNVAYASAGQAPSNGASAHSLGAPRRHSAPSNPQHLWTPNPIASKTMKMATGTYTAEPQATASVSTTVFELAPPRSGMGEMGFVDSRGASLQAAERALYNRSRPAKERFRWGFNPDKDQRVGSLLRWIAAMSNGLATIGLQRFLETQERGALFANADFRVPSAAPGMPAQPAFDWITLDQIQRTLDATLQESVALYDPAFQVIVFVFLLSPSGNSMALWRRKLNVPESVRDTYRDDILEVMQELKDYPVYVDELPVKPEAAAPKKKKVRFAFLRRLFGGKKSAAAS
ncbi:hypothetical protein C8Q79DRAFT_1006946 [Trametes meyenii]|nr:hypothetical protein C8Q79DRAFT_1006946 [Trametes meyenii]